jgi:hypothetical protein
MDNHLEAAEGWGAPPEDWSRLQGLLELVRREHRTELSPERRAEIRARVLERLEKAEAGRRRRRVLAAAASIALLAVLALRFTRSRIR